MFYIDAVITFVVYDRNNALSCIEDKTDLLLRLVDFELNFHEIAYEISRPWYKKTEEIYSSEEQFLDSDTKTLIMEYAVFSNNLSKIKKLINKLLSINDGVYDHDGIATEIENEMSVIRCIDDFEFTGNTNTT